MYLILTFSSLTPSKSTALKNIGKVHSGTTSLGTWWFCPSCLPGALLLYIRDVVPRKQKISLVSNSLSSHTSQEDSLEEGFGSNAFEIKEGNVGEFLNNEVLCCVCGQSCTQFRTRECMKTWRCSGYHSLAALMLLAFASPLRPLTTWRARDKIPFYTGDNGGL